MRYRLLYGRHVMTHPDDQKVGPEGKLTAKTLKDMPEGTNVNWSPRDIILTAGAVFETDEDLTRKNGRQMDGKYELISEAGLAVAASPFHWDRTRETLQQFNARMKSMGADTSDPTPQPTQQPVLPQQVAAHEPANPPSPPYASQEWKTWDIAKLREFAASEEIDITGAATRDAILKKIAAAQSQLVGAGK